jgi:hypothetical protein
LRSSERAFKLEKLVYRRCILNILHIQKSKSIPFDSQVAEGAAHEVCSANRIECGEGSAATTGPVNALLLIVSLKVGFGSSSTSEGG